MTLTRTFGRIAGAVVIALTLGATALTAAPAQAAGMQFGFGNGSGSFSFQFGNPPRHHRPVCLGPRQITDAIAAQGYRNVRIMAYGRPWVFARGTHRGSVYKLTVNACTGRIVDRDRLWRR